MIAPKLSQKMIDEECDKWVKTQTKLTIGEAFKAGAKFSKQEEREAIEQEHKDLIWFRDEINKRAVPGDTDSKDAAYELIKELHKESETWRLMCCGLLSEVENLKSSIEFLKRKV